MLKQRPMRIGDHLRWLARAGKREPAKNGGLKRYLSIAALSRKAVSGRRSARTAALGRARAGGWLRGAAAEKCVAGSSQRPEIIRPRRSRRTPLLLTARRRPARGARSGGLRRRHGSVKRCAGCSRARNHSALGARPLATLLLCSLAARRGAAGRPPRPPRTRATHTHSRARERERPRSPQKPTQCFSP